MIFIPGHILLLSFALQAISPNAVLANDSTQPFFDFMKMGLYSCDPSLCEIPDKTELSLSIKHRYALIMLRSVTGFVEASHIGANKEYITEINWDDGSGKSKREIITLHPLNSKEFIFTDQHNKRNLMHWVSALD